MEFVRPLVLREANVADEAIEATADARDEGQPGHHVAQPLLQVAAPGQHGRDDAFIPGGAVRLEPVAVVVLGEVAQEGETALRKSFEGHAAAYLGQFRSWLK